MLSRDANLTESKKLLNRANELARGPVDFYLEGEKNKRDDP